VSGGTERLDGAGVPAAGVREGREAVENLNIAEQRAGVDERTPDLAQQVGTHSERPALAAQVTATISECPLHMAVRRLARAAVTQHVFYAEGEYAPRPALAEEMHAWVRIHDLVRGSVCPASRAPNVTLAEIELAIASATAMVHQDVRSELRAALVACGARSTGEGCPVEREPAKPLFE
jgi:hypothetical protein